MHRLKSERLEEFRVWASQPADFTSEQINELLAEIDALRAERDEESNQALISSSLAKMNISRCRELRTRVEKLRAALEQLLSDCVKYNHGGSPWNWSNAKQVLAQDDDDQEVNKHE